MLRELICTSCTYIVTKLCGTTGCALTDPNVSKNKIAHNRQHSDPQPTMVPTDKHDKKIFTITDKTTQNHFSSPSACANISSFSHKYLL